MIDPEAQQRGLTPPDNGESGRAAHRRREWMTGRVAAPVWALLLLGSAALPLAAARSPKAIQYESEVLPLFRAKCIGCHGAGLPEAGLDLRTRGDLLEGGYSGPAVVPGSPEKSVLYQTLADGRMPKGGRRFTPQELRVVADWIRGGAAGAGPETGHWAFRPPKATPVPPVKAADRVRNPIDAFLLRDLERKGLSYTPEADRRTLIRRLTFDLIGLPPTPAEIEAFVRDARPDAYERLVDRLLSDPRYGERWARHWLDTAGYADSEGVLQEDRIRPNAWRYRDYVIQSLNADKPYDQFLREQIAGDELVDYRNAPAFTPKIVETLTATGFLRTAVDATRPDFNPHQYGEYQYRMLHDTQTIVFSTALGLTVQCARCHSHKYEPISQKDYYAVQALFMGAVRPRGKLLPTALRQIVAATAEEQKHAREVNAQVDAAVAALNQELAALTAEHQARDLERRAAEIPEADRTALIAAVRLPEAKRSAEQKTLVTRHAKLIRTPEALAAADSEFREKQAAIVTKRNQENSRRIVHTELRAFYDQDANPPPTPLLQRGDWLRPGEPVEPGVPELLARVAGPLELSKPTPGAATTGRRLAFARWITQADHPLTARVMVNRVWAHHFGVGIVPSVENFGRSGQAPTNQDLLDWLACSFVAGAGGKGSGAGETGEQARYGLPVRKGDAVGKFRSAHELAQRDQPREQRNGTASHSLRHRHPRPLQFANNIRGAREPGTRESGTRFTAASSGSEGSRYAVRNSHYAPVPNPRPPTSGPTEGLAWSLKKLHRLIVTSSAYRQGSGWNERAGRIDPENRLVWRQRPRRLEAEAIRDAMLAVSGTLDGRMFGEPVANVTQPTGEIVAAGEEQGGRRSIYLLVRRSMPVTLLNTFDAPVMETNCTRRTTSTTATQALALMNGTFLNAQGRHFATRLLRESPPAGGAEAPVDLRTVRHAFSLALGRAPSAKEQAEAMEFLRGQIELYRKGQDTAKDAGVRGYADFCAALLSSNEFIYVD